MREQLRDRLYAAYASTHAGCEDGGSIGPSFRRDILPHLPRDRNVDVVDVGCGQGHLVRHLQNLGFTHARGVDISPEQVKVAREAGITQVRLGDYREFLGEQSIDVVIATDFFEHLTKWEVLEALDCIRRALRGNGLVILRVPNAISPFEGNYRHGDITHETSFTPRSLRQLASAAGFTALAICACPPPAHGLKSSLRAALWGVASGLMKAALIAETGQLRGHVVTQNVVAVFRAKE